MMRCVNFFTMVEVADEVLAVLASYPVDGLLVGRLRQRLRHRSAADIRTALTRLLRSGRIKFEQDHWKLARDCAERIEKPERLFAEEFSAPCVAVKIGKEFSCSAAREDGGGDDGGTQTAAPFHRKILNYFADVAELEGSTQGKLKWEDRAKLWIPVYFRDRWWTRNEGESCFWELPASGQVGSFYTVLSSSRERQQCLRIGYPIHVEKDDDEEEFFLRPLFFSPVELLPLQRTKSGATVHLRMTHNLPIINGAWRKTLHGKGADEVLLENLGYDADGEINEEGRATINYESLARNLYLTPAHPQIREDLDPLKTAICLTPPQKDGIINGAMLFIAEPGPMCKRVIQNLRTIANEEIVETALAQLLIPKGSLGAAPPNRPYDVPVLLPSGRDFNGDQFYAAISAQNVPLVSVQGPPGTGKSFMVAGIMLSLILNGKSVLLASRNHKAIDAVQEKFCELEQEFLGDEAKILPVTLLRRMAYKDKGKRKDTFRSVAKELLESAEARKRLRDSRGTEIAEQWRALKSKIGRARELLKKIGKMYGAREQIIDLEDWLWRAEDGLFALSFWRRWVQRIANLWQRWRLQTVHRVPDPIEKIDDLVADFLALQRDMGRTVAEILPHCIQRLWAVDLKRAELLKRHCDIEPSEKELAKAVLRHSPAWATTSQSVGQLPEVAGLFDYLIIDEAGQSDIGSALPLLWRAKHGCIVGDPKQLAPIRHIGGKTEDRLLREHHISKGEAEFFLHSRNSLFECADHHAHVKQRLRQHYRCATDIARYFNRFFYDNSLQLMTDEEKLRLPKRFNSGLHWEDVRGEMERPPGFLSGWKCEAEAEAVAQWVHRLLLEGDWNVGIVTFFAGQRTLIQRKIDEKLSTARPKGNWSPPVVATAHGFQGGECDVICLSLCYGENEGEGSHSFLRKNLNLLNVAVSRARALCVIFGNGAAAEDSSIGEIQGLWRHSQGKLRLEDEKPFESPWEEKLFYALRRRGVETIPQYVTCGRRLDLAHIGDGLRLDIEVDGVRYHALAEGVHCPEDLWRNHVLQTAGWRILRFWVSELRRDMDGCVGKVLETIEAWKRKNGT